MKNFKFIFLIFIGSAIGVLYGILHDEITFTYSPEFYTKVRFEQININHLPPRAIVAYIGFLNTMVYSIIISTLFTISGILFKNSFRNVLTSFIISMIVAFIFGIIGLILGLYISNNELNDKVLSDNIINVKNFKIVEMVHNFSYVGGIVGMFVGIGWLLFISKKN